MLAQVIAVAMIAAGLGLGVEAWNGVSWTNLFVAHLALGFLAVFLAVLQITALVYRPHLDSDLRCACNSLLKATVVPDSYNQFLVTCDSIFLQERSWYVPLQPTSLQAFSA